VRRPRVVAFSVMAVFIATSCRSGHSEVKANATTIPPVDTTISEPPPGDGCNFSSTPSKVGGWAALADVFVTAPVADATAVYAGANSASGPGGCVFALDGATGQLKWQSQRPIMAGSLPLLAGKLVVAAVNEAPALAIVGLDAETGQRKWRISVAGTTTTPPALVGDLVYVSGGSSLRAIQASTGRARWKVDRQPLAVATGAAGTFVTFAQDDTTTALDPRDGKQKWATPLGTRSAVVKAVTTSVVVLENSPNDLYGLDAASGRQLWEMNMPGSDNSTLAVAGDELYLSADDGKAYAMDAKTGRIRWSKTIGLTLGPAPMIVNAEVLFASTSPDSAIVAFDRTTGVERWRAPTSGGPITSELLHVGDDVLVGTQRGVLCRFTIDGIRRTCNELIGEAVGSINRMLSAGGGRVYSRIGNQTIAASP
jgi:outer membrane protein assembly factor BamB